MQGLKIDIREIKSNTLSKWISYPVVGFFILLGLCLSPLLLVFWLMGMFYRLLFRNKESAVQNSWKVIKTGTGLELRYKLVFQDNVPVFIHQYFDQGPLVTFDADPKNEFFEGYFTDLIVERTDGVFVQKVVINQSNDNIQSLPFYFFNYSTHEIVEIKDLYGYELDIKGNPNDFMISALGEENELEIRIRKE